MESFLKNLDVEKFNQVYFGKQGCVCGCGGTYNETVKSFKSAITKLVNKVISGEKLKIMEGINEYIVSWEGEERAIRIYTTENLSEFVNLN